MLATIAGIAVGINIVASPGMHAAPWYLRVIFALPFLVVCALILVLAQVVAHRHKATEQKKREGIARELIDDLKAGKQPFYSLYLRPFESTGKLIEQVKENAALTQDDTQFRDLESLLAEAVDLTTPLLALGSPGEQSGAARILVPESQWKEELTGLAKNATLIFVIPSERPGTKWEITWLLSNGLIEKCVFLMPASIGSTDWSKAWRAAVEQFREVSLDLPAYQHRGMIFTIGKNRTIRAARTLPAGALTAATLRINLERLFAGVSDEPVLKCPTCGTKYKMSDYNPECSRITCTACKTLIVNRRQRRRAPTLPAKAKQT